MRRLKTTITAISGVATVGIGLLACGGLVAVTESSEGGSGDGANAGDAGADTRTSTGYFFVTQSWLPAEFVRPRTYECSVYGNFGEAVAVTSHTCAATTVGECVVDVCNFPAGSRGDPYLWPSSLNAGAVTVAGPLGSYVLPYRPGDGGPGTAYNASPQGPLFNGGDTLNIFGAGGADLPAFAAESVIAPNDIVVTSPACVIDSLAPDAGCADIDRRKDLTVAWTGSGAGKVMAVIATFSQTQSTNLTCTFDAASGTGTIPAAVLGVLQTTEGKSGVAQYVPQNEAHFNVGNVATTLFVQARGAGGRMRVF